MTEIEKPSVNNSKISSPFLREWSSPFFSLEESYDKTIDVQASFVPDPICRTALIRTILFVFTFASTASSFIQTEDRVVWFGYLTHISAMLTILYFALMMICSFNPSLIPQPEAGSSPNFLIRFVWVMYSLSTVYEICLSLIYWPLVYDGTTLKYHRVVLHGVFIPLLLFDGCILGKIPVRIKHVLFTVLVGLIYIIWTIIHSLTDIGVSVEDRLDGDGDPLYNVLNWQDSPKTAAIVSFVAFFVLMPFFFWVVWMISLYSTCCKFDGSGRKVIVTNKDKSDPSSLL